MKQADRNRGRSCEKDEDWNRPSEGEKGNKTMGL
jgi:hypothetical protein